MQVLHVAAPMRAVYVPAAQAEHEAAPAVEDFPATQDKHEIERVLRLVAEYLPAAQLVHAEAPESVTKEPAGQDVQLDAPAAEYVPATHEEHADDPVTVEYLPAGQFEQPVAPTME